MILMAVGRGPNTAGFNLEELDRRINRSALAVDERMQTSVPGIYAIGDVNGQSMPAHTASAGALTAASRLLGGNPGPSTNSGSRHALAGGHPERHLPNNG